MMEARKPESNEQIMQRLTRLMLDQPEIEGVAVITIDGIPVASILPPRIAEHRLTFVAPMVAASASLASNLLIELNQVDTINVFIRSEIGYVVIIALSTDRLLVIISNPQAKRSFPEFPLAPTFEPIFPWQPPGRLSAHAKPEYPDDDHTP